jgi:flagellar basal body-associated protein FliL
MSISERALGWLVVALLAGAAPAVAADRSAVVMPVPGQPFFVQLPPIFVPVIGKDRVSRQVSVALAVEIADGAHAPDIEPKRAALNDAFLNDIYVYVQQRGGIGTTSGERALKDRLRDTAQRILDPVEVKEVLVEEFFEQSR